MNVKNCEKKEKSTVGLVVEVSPEEFDKAIDEAYRKAKSRISVPGFRKGKAPRKIVENMYGANVFYEDALEGILPAVFSFGAGENKLETVGYPTLDNVEFGDDKSVTITYTVAVYPTVTIGEYKGIHAEKPLVEVTESDIDTEIEKVRYQNARIETITNRPVVNGDTVTIDYCGTLDGVAFDGGTAENYELKIGSGSFIPGFEEKIQGMKVEEERDLDLTFPKEYHAKELAGKDVVFHVKVHEIKSQVLPEVDDEFVKDVSEFDTLAEYREDIKKTLTASKMEAAQKTFENNVLDKLSDSVEGDIPDALVDQYVDGAVDNMRGNLAQYGMELEMYLNMMNMNLETFRDNLRPNAEKNVKNTLALEKVAELEKLEPTEEELEAGYKEMAETYGMELDKVKDQINKEMLSRELNLRAASKLVIDAAVAEDPKPEEKEEKKAEEKPEAEEKPKKKTTTTRKKAAPKKTETAEKKAAKDSEETQEEAAEDKAETKE